MGFWVGESRFRYEKYGREEKGCECEKEVWSVVVVVGTPPEM
jgi:hypothetical protein